jgi:hypothetical protein
MSDLGILLAAIAANRMRDRTYGALTQGTETARPVPERPRRFGFGRTRTPTARAAPPRPTAARTA